LKSVVSTPAELLTTRLTLRSIRESDDELYCSLFCDAETMRFIGPAWTRAAAAEAFRGVLAAASATPPRALFLVMAPKTGQAPVGLCSLQNFDASGRRIEMGVMVAAQVRARGLASEALVAVIAHAFATLPVDEVWVRIALGHTACERTAAIIGLVRHAEVAPEDRARNVSRWSAYRGSWRPGAAPEAVSVHYSAAND
jgi:ribosomal-protein-alanine N-acetyltransferase